MAALLAHCHISADQEGAIYPISPARDLYQVAELIELCFASRLDANGRAAVGEMKTIGQLGPLLWILAPFDLLGLGFGHGYVWRVGRRVVGNASLYPGGLHPWLGRGWLVANVAVHPDYRRRGIARQLMQATLNLAKRLGGGWVALQVEADNVPAFMLYQGLGFQAFETLTQWENERVTIQPSVGRTATESTIRKRCRADAAAEVELIYRRARQGAMAWTQPLEHGEVRGSLLGGWFSGPWLERWVLFDPLRPGWLGGAIWIETAGWGRSRLSLFLDPAVNNPATRQALLRHVLSSPDLEGRHLRIETVADDKPVEELLEALHFQRARSLVQMRITLNA